MLSAISKTGRIFTFIAEYLGIRGVWDVFRIVIDVLIVAYCIYKLLVVLRDTRALQLFKGVVLILIISLFANLLQLDTLTYIIRLLFDLLPILLIVMFQPELRRAIEGIGQNTISNFFMVGKKSVADIYAMVEEIVKAVTEMSKEMVGALIVFELETSLGEIVRTGTVVDANVSMQLLRMIFVKNTPLHDGAVIIRDGRIYAAACYLPLSDDLNLSKDLGTRHRAGIGVTQATDAVSVIVSEETGTISLARNGVLTRDLTPDLLRKLLRDILQKEQAKRQIRSKNDMTKDKKNVQS